jgi:broad specificity phosphatase PhoE
MSSILLIALLGLAFVALLKIADTFRDLSFEIRQTRQAIEQQTEKLEAFHREWWAWAQREPAERAEESRRRHTPTLDEIMEDVG